MAGDDEEADLPVGPVHRPRDGPACILVAAHEGADVDDRNLPPFVQLVANGLALVFAASLDALGTYLAPRLEQRRRVNEQVARATAG